jgi:hypothetical protein
MSLQSTRELQTSRSSPPWSPNALLGFLMQAAALGALLGTLVGYWRRRRDEQFDTFPIVTRWTVVCLLVAAGYAVWKAIP